MPDTAQWDGRTYYGRAQLKPAPFNNALVGSYVFLAGLSGAAQVLATALDYAAISDAEPVVRHGRLLSLLAPIIGTVCLICDLHTPKRFYNMLRLVKTTSPMSLGSWALVAFSGASAISAAPLLVRAGWRQDSAVAGWLQGLSRVARIPAALAGGVLATYTASLFSATSAPLWAAGAKGLAVRFAAASVASAASALRLVARSGRRRRDLDSLAVAGLAIELGATLASDHAQQQAGVRQTPSSRDIAGVAVPLVLFLASDFLPRRAQAISQVAAAAALTGSLLMRIGVIKDGEQSAAQPNVSLRLAQPDNLPRR
ncbi:MAG TPA: NrfD/PsrC family molybdoenzyme membrane anchor subunit [Rhodopila sp.]